MLALFRRKKASLNWVLWVLIIVLGAGMVLLFVDPPTGTTSTVGGRVASVAGEPITVLSFRDRYQGLVQRYREQFGEQNEQILKQLRLGDQAVNSLISEYAIGYEAKRLGLGVTDQEIQQEIVSYPAFQDPQTKRFIGLSQYRDILSRYNLTPGEFEQSVRRQILRDKLQSLLTEGVEPTQAEVRKEFARQNQEARVRYVYFDESEAPDVEVGEEELASFYEENAETYKTAEKRKISYLTVPRAVSKVQLSEEQIQERMESIPEIERMRASHILFKVKPGDDDSVAREKAQQLLAEIRKGADFAEMARQFSEDESASSGGDLGFFTGGEVVQPFWQGALALEPGQVSEPVRTDFGVHLIKLTAKPRNSAESRRVMAEFQLKEEEAGRRAKERIDGLLARWKEGATLEELAQEDGIRTGETDFFTFSDRITDLPVRTDFNRQVFTLAPGEFTETYVGTTGYVVARLDEIQAPQLPQLEEVREQVVEDFKTKKGEEIAQRRADAIFEKAEELGSLQKAAEEEGLEVTSTGFFKAGAEVDEILKFSPILHERVAFMKVGQVSPAIRVAGKLVVFEVVEKSELDEAAFEEQKEQIAENLRQQKRDSFFVSYVQNVVERLRQEEKIEIDRLLLDDLTQNL